MSRGRRSQRFIRRLETEFSATGKSYIGISSDFSISGLFVRTNHAFVPGTIVDLVVHLPDGKEARLRGNVRRAIKTPIVSLKNGMGIELLEKDENYTEFIRSLSDNSAQTPDVSQPASDTPPSESEFRGQDAGSDFLTMRCPHCGIKNRVNKEKLPLGPICGRCGTALSAT